MKKSKDLSAFLNVLPYSSELFGVYQPLLGWKSKRMNIRFQRGWSSDKRIVESRIKNKIKDGLVKLGQDIESGDDDSSNVNIRLNTINLKRIDQDRNRTGSFLIDHLQKSINNQGTLSEDIWDDLIKEEKLQEYLTNNVAEELNALAVDEELIEQLGGLNEFNTIVKEQADKESFMASFLLSLKESQSYDRLEKIVMGLKKLPSLFNVLKKRDPFEYLDPHGDLDRVIVSPISVVHIFRQYFFEFDTFLGQPVEHVWLSPGSSVELVETSSRKTIVEKTYETEFETTTKIEEETKEQEELSSSVKKENRDNTKFGFNVEVEQGWVGGSAKASTSLDMERTQQMAREVTHRRMKEQSRKLSTEIRKNYRTSFKTINENTDTRSTKYVLNNTTDELINYELRRKMRQVGVQVQDIGTYLCWQAFVDEPGKDLGISSLVHIAKPADIGQIQEPEAVPFPESFTAESTISITFRPKTNTTVDEDKDETYIDGSEHDTEGTNEGTPESIYHVFGPYNFLAGKSGYIHKKIELDGQGAYIRAEPYILENDEGSLTFNVVVREVNFRGADSIPLKVRITWFPSQDLISKIDTQNQDRMDQYNEETKRAHENSFVEAAKERIKLASQVETRKFEDLREEERIVIYRSLLQDILTKDIPVGDSRTRHASSELLSSIFDFDKMLYFVAPEWWKPRIKSSQVFSAKPKKKSNVARSGTYNSKSLYAYKKGISSALRNTNEEKVPDSNQVGWGGINDKRRDKYFITDDSKPAKLGSSLGWLLQLDGDNMRNQFLNAPWVKAVIPIRPGKEKTAFNWLQRIEVEGSDGLDSEYIAPTQELNNIPKEGQKVTIKDAISHLCNQVKEKHDMSNQVGSYPSEEINDDNKVSATPLDKVYEHGFYPNQDGFKLNVNEPFEVFDQWIEILPTDQVVPVAVKYDPISGRQINES